MPQVPSCDLVLGGIRDSKACAGDGRWWDNVSLPSLREKILIGDGCGNHHDRQR
jgi:hypothetical protein